MSKRVSNEQLLAVLAGINGRLTDLENKGRPVEVAPAHVFQSSQPPKRTASAVKVTKLPEQPVQSTPENMGIPIGDGEYAWIIRREINGEMHPLLCAGKNEYTATKLGIAKCRRAKKLVVHGVLDAFLASNGTSIY